MKTHAIVTTSLRHSFLAVGILGFTAIASHAAVVTWGAATGISGDSNVSTAGTLVNARNFGGPGAPPTTTVNGVAFLPFAVDGLSTTYTAGNATLSTVSDRNPTFATTSTFQSLSAPYTTLLATATKFTADRSYKLTFSGLTAGQAYQFQVWQSNSTRGYPGPTSVLGNAFNFQLSIGDGLGNNVDLYAGDNGIGGGPNGTNRAATPGQFVLGTFTANALTQDFLFSNGEIDGWVNGFQLRALAAAPAVVPEPGSALAGMLALGVCLSGLAGRSRGKVLSS